MKISLISMFVLFIVSCSSQDKLAKDNFSFIKDNNSEQNTADNIVAIQDSTDTLQILVEQIRLYKESADSKLAEKDTIGAEIYIYRAIDLINDLTADQVSDLSDDSLFTVLSQSIMSLQQTIDLESDIELTDDDLIRQEVLALDKGVESFDNEVVYVENNPIPYTTNRKVENVIKFFTTRGRNTFQRWLDRGAKYEHLIKRILREEGMPEDLYYLAMIESGFNTKARSWASAVGPWQFIRATGKAYGLDASYWADDRKDMENSTRAAAKHLRDLYNRFGDWYLAMAGYNCNPAKIARRVRQYNTTDYFKLKNIPRETRGYVPNFLAARIIGNDPEKYGFTINKVDPIEYERIYVKEVIDLNHVAIATKSSYEHIKELNPAIVKWLTPSDRDSMYLNIPVGTADNVKSYIASLSDDQKQKMIRYRIKNGDALSLISRRFGISMSQIRAINKMKNNNLRAGKYLYIPVPANKYETVQKKYDTTKSSTKRTVSRPSSTKDRTKVIYVVKSGDTLGHIAERYQTRAQNIRNWNGLRFRQAIRVGQKLTIWAKKGSSPIDLASLNQIDTSKYNYYKVRSGDSLWEIAKKYNTSIADLKKLNNMTNNNIKVGSMLIVSSK